MAYVGIDRKIVDHWIYQDAEYFKVWFEMLYRARFVKEPETKMVEGYLVELEYSHFIFGRIKWSERIGISERRLRTLIDKLIAEDMIQLVKRAPKFSVYRVTNFDKYRQFSDQQETQTGQGIDGYSDQQNDQQTTSRRPADDQQMTTKEESNNAKPSKKVNEYTPLFEQFWDSYPKQKRIGKPAAFKGWNKLIKKETPEYIIGCTMNYSSYVIAKDITDPTFIKQPNNFLNDKDEYYKQFETPVLIHSKGGGNGGKYRTGTQGFRHQQNTGTGGDVPEEWESVLLGTPGL